MFYFYKVSMTYETSKLFRVYAKELIVFVYMWSLYPHKLNMPTPSSVRYLKPLHFECPLPRTLGKLVCSRSGTCIGRGGGEEKNYFHGFCHSTEYCKEHETLVYNPF